MCLICIDLDRNYLKPAEARRALREMRSELTPEHVAEVEAKVLQAERDAATPEGQIEDPVKD
jgi:hypothetical protein